MIVAKNADGSYSQVGFVKGGSGADIEHIYARDGTIVFDKGFTREIRGAVPLTINGIGKDLKAWSITGNTVQDSASTDVLGCGDYDDATGLYTIFVVTSADDAEPITTPIYLATPLYADEVLSSDGTITRSDGTTATFSVPSIPTFDGATTLDVDTEVKPSEMHIKYKSNL